MAVIESTMQPRPVPVSPNVGAAVVRSGNQQQVSPPVSTEQKVQNDVEQQVKEKDVQKAIQQANVELASSNTSVAISFGYEEKLGQLFVQVTDKNSGEVVREIPSKDFIQHKIAMREMIGLLLDKTA